MTRHASRWISVGAVTALVAGVGATLAVTAQSGPASGVAPDVPRLAGARVDYNVLLAEGTSLSASVKAIRASGGTVTRRNDAIGLLTVSAPESGFADRMDRVPGVDAVAPVAILGRVPAGGSTAPAKDAVEKEAQLSAAPARTTVPAPATAALPARAALMDPLDDQLWGMADIHAFDAHEVQPGDPQVLVGIIDTGVDGTHPDLAPNFDASLSRNFTTDIPTDPLGNTIDGPCEVSTCIDPVDEDDNGHGTHVAGTIGAALNGIGVSGVAPDVTLVNIRAGQDAGYFFLQPTLDALTYAGDAGIDVVNMSFYVDPWLFNCTANAADSAEAQRQQKLILWSLRRAMRYAWDHGVTQVVSLGNGHEDLGAPPDDASSPDYPIGTAYTRSISDSTCFSMPIEGPHALGIASYGPSLAKSDFSNYGQHATVSAPGGWFRDFFGTDRFRTNANLILSAYPQKLGVTAGNIDPDTGEITPQGEVLGVQRSCDESGSTCGYYQFLQGTSMAAPHATGVAALAVSEFGAVDEGTSGFGLPPKSVRRVLNRTAQDTPCPDPATVDYLDEGRDASYTATCVGTAGNNGFYGQGRVDALSAVVNGGTYLPPPE